MNDNDYTTEFWVDRPPAEALDVISDGLQGLLNGHPWTPEPATG